MNLEKIEKPRFIKIVSGGKVLLSVGDTISLAEKFDVGRPIIDSALPSLIKDRYQAVDSVEEISKNEFRFLLSRVGDSAQRVKVI